MQTTLVQFIVRCDRLAELASAVHRASGYNAPEADPSKLLLPVGHPTFGVFTNMTAWLDFSRGLVPLPNEPRLMAVRMGHAGQYFGWTITSTGTGKIEILPASDQQYALVHVSYAAGSDELAMLEVLRAAATCATRVIPIEVTPAARELVGDAATA